MIKTIGRLMAQGKVQEGPAGIHSSYQCWLQDCWIMWYKERMTPESHIFQSRHKGDGVQITDEPTGNLDSRTEMEVVAMLKSCVAKYGQTLVMITHDETIAQMSDRTLIIEDGKVVG